MAIFEIKKTPTEKFALTPISYMDKLLSVEYSPLLIVVDLKSPRNSLARGK